MPLEGMATRVDEAALWRAPSRRPYAGAEALARRSPLSARDRRVQMTNDPNEWMWSEALAMLNRAERLHRQMFTPVRRAEIAWEPPVDVLETEDHVLVLAALPGVNVSQVDARIESGVLVIAGQRILPRE